MKFSSEVCKGFKEGQTSTSENNADTVHKQCLHGNRGRSRDKVDKGLTELGVMIISDRHSKSTKGVAIRNVVEAFKESNNDRVNSCVASNQMEGLLKGGHQERVVYTCKVR